MQGTLTDEETIAHAEEQVEHIAKAIACTRLIHPEASVEALAQVLLIVNGQGWIGATEMARARVRAKALGPVDP
jgi:hypothetical protein